MYWVLKGSHQRGVDLVSHKGCCRIPYGVYSNSYSTILKCLHYFKYTIYGVQNIELKTKVKYSIIKNEVISYNIIPKKWQQRWKGMNDKKSDDDRQKPKKKLFKYCGEILYFNTQVKGKVLKLHFKINMRK